MHTDLPVVVGFGISSSDHVSEVAKIALLGVVVGSALVKCIPENLGEPDLIVKKIGQKAKSLSSGLYLS